MTSSTSDATVEATGQGDGNPGTDGSDVDEPAIARDDCFEVVANRRRRYVVHALRRRENGRAELSEVVEQVAAWERDTTPGDVSYEDRKSVHVSLYQHHLPKMADAGVVEYDKRSGEVRLTGRADVLDPLLADTDGDAGRPWALYFPAVSAAAGGVVLLGYLDAAVAPSDAACGAIAVAAFALVSVAYLYDTRIRPATPPEGPPPEVPGE